MQVTGSPTIIDCHFIGNTSRWGGGLSGASGALARCTFIENVALSLPFTATTGGGAYLEAATVTNCLFVSNHAGTRGGALAAGTSAPSIHNCTLVDNTADQGNGVSLIHPDGSIQLRNCIVLV